jgi:hypothetical protein
MVKAPIAVWRDLLAIGSIPAPGPVAGGFVVCVAWSVFTAGYAVGAHLAEPGWHTLWLAPYLTVSWLLWRLGLKFQRRLKWAQGA